MGKRWQERNGIAIPVESREQETPAVASVYVQQGLVQDQLPRYLASLIEAGAAIEAVFRQSFGGIVASSRFSVVYRHTEELGTEVFC